MRTFARLGWVGVLVCGCGTSPATAGGASHAPAATGPAPGSEGAPWDERADAVDPAERARAGGWTGAPLEAPPRYCDDDGGTEWCDGARDDDCDGRVDEGCADCVSQPCVRFAISAEEMRSGASANGEGECVGPVFCGRVDGYASTEPPGGCGDFHCGTLIYADRTARPHYCTVYGRCESNEFLARGFSW